MAVLTMEEARALALPGWNLRCNRCGGHPALWRDSPRREGWGRYAWCDDCYMDVRAEVSRHDREMRPLLAVNFEQPHRADDATGEDR